MDSERATRIAENEALFRRVNEQVQGLSETFSTLTNRMTVVCECGDQSCIEQIQLAVPEYEQVRSDPTLFVIKPGHEASDLEQPVTKSDRYWVIKKEPGISETLAKQLDTRE